MKNHNSISILFITHYSSMYGANQSLCTLIIELREKYKITPVILLRDNGPICEFLDKHNVKYYIMHFFWWVYKSDSLKERVLSTGKQIRNFWRIIFIWNKLKKENISCIYTNSITINIGIFLSKMFNCPHIWHIREKLEVYGFNFTFSNALNKWIFRHGAEQYILISDFLLNNYKNILPIGKIKRIYNGIKIPEYSLYEKPFNILNICVIGLIDEQKNQIEILKAIKILIKERDYDLRLHLIGEKKGKYFELLENYTIENKLDNFVSFHGHQDEICNLLNIMHIGIVSAHDEGFGRATVEFMLHQIPVIVSNSGANPEITKDGITGFMYELSNEKDLANKIEIFIKNPELIKDLGFSARKFAIQNFSSEKNSKEIYETIKEVIIDYNK